MELSKKIKTALDETRMLILGGQILLGFELRSVFADAFEQLPDHAKYIDALALLLMTLVVALLITPGPYHRIVEGGTDCGSFHALVTDIADIALLPFALAIGLDVFIAAERVFGTSAAIAIGGAGTVLALALWYGMPRIRAQMTGQRERAMAARQRHERQEPPLHEKIEQALTEGRVILPGAQALFGFQLSIVLTNAFEQLPALSRIVHAASIGLLALSMMLLMAPAAYHRIVYAGEENQEVQRVAGWLITAATLPLALGLAGDIYVVMAKIAGQTAGWISAAAALLCLFALWYGFPIVAALRRGDTGMNAGKAQRQSG